MPKWVTKAAQALLDEWSIGKYSRFLDEPADFDSATVEEIADRIWHEYLMEKAQNEIDTLGKQLDTNHKKLVGKLHRNSTRV